MALLSWGNRPLTVRLIGVDLTDADMTLSVRQGLGYGTRETVYAFVEVPDSRLTKQLDGEDTLVIWVPTQAEAGQLRSGSARVQVNWMLNGLRDATDELDVDVAVNQIERVIGS